MEARILPERAARIRDVARAAGVSTATVSRALAFPDQVRPETRERVLAAVRSLNYMPHEAARSLRAGATRMILVVVPNLYSGAFFAGVVNGADEELAAAGYTMIMGSLDGNEDKARRLMELVYARQIDGIIVLSGEALVIEGRSVLSAGVPVVSICTDLHRPGMPTVLLNDEECAIMQTRHLLDLGHRRLLYISGIDGHYNEVMRCRGFRTTAKAAGAQTLRLPGNYTMASGAAAAQAFLALDQRPTGVVCCSDEMAIGFIKTVMRAGLRVPEDVSVVGFDGIEFAAYYEPALTTIRQPRADMGAAGARALLGLLRGDIGADLASTTLKGELDVRQSTGPAPD